MVRYVFSDHHFGHTNIIKYCDRPFSSVGEMNKALVDRHYETVDEDAVLIHLGNIAMDMQNGEETMKYFSQLDGDILLRGNHDVGLAVEDAPFPVFESCILTHKDYCFYCTHRPENIPDDWDEWAIHGHMHNNDVEKYPFVAYDNRRVNVSGELLNFRPVSLEAITRLLDECPPETQLRDIDQAKWFLEEKENE